LIFISSKWENAGCLLQLYIKDEYGNLDTGTELFNSSMKCINLIDKFTLVY